jgi:hypothetical protein
MRTSKEAIWHRHASAAAEVCCFISGETVPVSRDARSNQKFAHRSVIRAAMT